MDDFSFPFFKNYFGLPGSPNNGLEPGKRPFSSMSPSIIVDKNSDVKLVIGASGGSKITSAVAQASSLSIGDGYIVIFLLSTQKILLNSVVVYKMKVLYTGYFIV